MSKTNCINCGAAKDTDDIKCPFCGTTYLDFTAIDFTDCKPVVCQFVLPYSGRTVMSMLALPQLDEISMYSDSIDITGLDGRGCRYLPSAPQMHIGISFHPLVQKDGTMLKLRQEREE